MISDNQEKTMICLAELDGDTEAHGRVCAMRRPLQRGKSVQSRLTLGHGLDRADFCRPSACFLWREILSKAVLFVLNDLVQRADRPHSSSFVHPNWFFLG